MAYYEDKQLKCRDCKGTFTWSAGEQDFYEKRGFTEPKRCRECRQARKQQESEQRN